jgi:hypothetical protein
MLAGGHPFHADTPMGILMAHLNNPIPDVREANPDLPDAVQEVIVKAMAKTAEARYQTAGALAIALDEAMHMDDRLIVPAASTPPPTPEPFFPIAHLRYNLLAARDVLGEAQLDGVLLVAGLEEYIDKFPPEDMKQAYPVQRYAKLWRAIYDVYGVRGLRAVGRHTGQRVHLHSVDSPQDKRVRDAARAVLWKLSLEMRVRTGLKTLAHYYSDQGVELEEMDEHYVWRVRRCPNCWGWKSEEPVCYSWVGYLQAELAWGTKGKTFRIVETECRAQGDEACVFLIDKSPLETDG